LLSSRGEVRVRCWSTKDDAHGVTTQQRSAQLTQMASLAMFTLISYLSATTGSGLSFSVPKPLALSPVSYAGRGCGGQARKAEDEERQQLKTASKERMLEAAIRVQVRISCGVYPESIPRWNSPPTSRHLLCRLAR
jgi:hypothetical protein